MDHPLFRCVIVRRVANDGGSKLVDKTLDSWIMSTVTAVHTTAERTTADIVAGNIRAEAARLGLTQVELGRRLGMSQNQITTRWKGVHRWQLDELDSVASVLGVSVQDLVTDTQNPHRWIAPRGAAARSKGLEPPTF